MKKIGIIGAMEEEVILLKEKLKIRKIENIASMDFYEGIMEGKEIILVRCGIGKVNAAICTQILVDVFNVEAIINTGVAGALEEKLEIGDIVISSDAIQHDMDATGFGYKIGEIPRMEKSIFEADTNLVKLAKVSSEKTDDQCKSYIGRVVSGDQFISDRDKKNIIYKNFQPYCTEMEGAAIAHVCHLNYIPFVIIRAISDKADQSAEVNFSEFVEKAALHSSKMLEKMIEQI